MPRATRLLGACLLFAAAHSCSPRRRAPGGRPEDEGSVETPTSATGVFVWHELVARDPEAEAAFYAEVFGWRSTRDSDEHFTLAGDHGDVAGVSRLPTGLRVSGLTPLWVGRVAVGDVDATVAKTRRHGGQVALEPIDVAVGRFAILEDTWGTVLQVISARDASPAGPRPAGDFSWDELVTPDRRGALEFYGEVLGFRAIPVTGERFAYLGRGDRPVAGVVVGPDLTRPYWISYIDVRDLDRALSRAARGGAVLVTGPEDGPHGRVAKLEDPEGALVGLREVLPASE
jgi:predicted enzyme related to lactoylglutathione lyase